MLFKWYDAEDYNATTNPVPVTIPQAQQPGVRHVLQRQPVPGHDRAAAARGIDAEQCGEYYIISHNHALFQITSWGVNMTGPITYMRVDPPLPNSGVA